MTAVPVRYLSAEEFIEEMDRQDLAGKHGRTQEKWRITANYVKNRAEDKEKPFVLVDYLPIKWLELGHEIDPELAETYEQLETKAPPIFVRLSPFRLERDPDARPIVENGNHRVAVAMRQGKTLINAIMSRETWRIIRLMKENPALSFDRRALRRRNPKNWQRRRYPCPLCGGVC